MSDIVLAANRKYAGLPTVGGDLASHTKVLEALRDAVQVHERRTADVLSSFVRVKDLIDLGFAELKNSKILVPVDLTTTGGTDTDDQTAAQVSYDNATSGLTADDVQEAIDELVANGAGYGSATLLAAAILADAPVGYWKCDDASGTLVDSSGNGFDLATIAGTIVYRAIRLIKGDPSLYARFTTTSTGASRAGSLGLTMPLTGDYTIEGIVYPGNGLDAILFSILGNGETEATNAQCRSELVGAAFGSFWEFSAGTNSGVAGPAIRAWAPVHLVQVKDGTANTMSFYVNGVLVTAPTYANEPSGGSSVSTGLGFFTGGSGQVQTIGHVAFYDSKLSADRILVHAKAAGFY